MTVALTQGETVLITGINGYIASHIARELLQMGYNVRGTVRDKAKGEILKSSLVGVAKSTLELIVIEDMTAEGVFDDALKGVSGIVHSAALMSLDSDPNIVVTHALRSLSSILNSAKKESSVKRFVLTSSSIAASSPAPNQKFNITKSTYNKDAVEKAWAPPPYTPFQGLYVYAAAKVQSEQEFFRYLREENAQFVGNTVLPSSVMGPVLHPSQFGSTANWILDYYKGISEFLPQMPAQWFVDARDCAKLHVAALIKDDLKSRRVFAFAEPWSRYDVYQEVRAFRPDKSAAQEPVPDGRDMTVVDERPLSLELLKWMGKDGFTSLKQSVIDTIEAYEDSLK